jgi:[acyl-carrier-protein] S-malonyltransferase
MLDELSRFEQYQAPSAVVSDTLGYDLLAGLRKGTTSIHTNLASSLMTVLASVVSLDLLRQTEATSASVMGAAGYSVGQWIALYAAGAISLEQLIRIVHRRAAMMDECAAKDPGSMIAVIGIGESILENCCAEIRSRGLFVAIANYNAVGQSTLSMEKRAVSVVMQEVQALKPLKCVLLNAAGPWHSQMMSPAADALAEFLQGEAFRPTAIPIIDNTTGGFLPTAVDSCRRRLADQVSQPVRWSHGIETLVTQGAARFIEVGSGNMLTKFGFFINRNVQHMTFHTSLA